MADLRVAHDCGTGTEESEAKYGVRAVAKTGRGGGHGRVCARRATMSSSEISLAKRRRIKLSLSVRDSLVLIVFFCLKCTARFDLVSFGRVSASTCVKKVRFKK